MELRRKIGSLELEMNDSLNFIPFAQTIEKKGQATDAESHETDDCRMRLVVRLEIKTLKIFTKFLRKKWKSLN